MLPKDSGVDCEELVEYFQVKLGDLVHVVLLACDVYLHLDVFLELWGELLLFDSELEE